MTTTIPFRNFLAVYKGDDPANFEWRLYQIRELDGDRVLQTFVGRVTQTQAARSSVERVIERWCQLFPERLRLAGEAIAMDLDEVERIIDRR